MRLRMIVVALWLCWPAIVVGLHMPRWQPHDCVFGAKETPDNPFEILFPAEVRGPNGTELTVPGFSPPTITTAPNNGARTSPLAPRARPSGLPDHGL